jgi:multimeric flavodoxin WrbA
MSVISHQSKSILVILGSARRESDTKKFARSVFARKECVFLDLCDYAIEEYKYDGNYSAADQFAEVMSAILSHDIIVFCTPVYWYAMSARMKILFDRFTDCLTIDKEKGRKLRGRKVAMLSVGTDLEIPEGFEIPFSRTADYLGMKYVAGAYFSTAEEFGTKAHITSKADFVRKIETAK